MNSTFLYGEYQQSLSALIDQINQSGVKYNSVAPRRTGNGEPVDFISQGVSYFVEITYPDSVARKDREKTDLLARGFEYQKRKAKPRNNLRSDLMALSDKDFKDLVIELVILQLEDNPKFASKLGKGIDGDEVVVSLK
jgi:hypothetical protein